MTQGFSQCSPTRNSKLNVCSFDEDIEHLSRLMVVLSDAVDRRGRKVKQSSSEDLRKYYDLDGESDNVMN